MLAWVGTCTMSRRRAQHEWQMYNRRLSQIAVFACGGGAHGCGGCRSTCCGGECWGTGHVPRWRAVLSGDGDGDSVGDGEGGVGGGGGVGVVGGGGGAGGGGGIGGVGGGGD
eukprot:352673-Pleurochrysis_carterae.AAC.1